MKAIILGAGRGIRRLQSDDSYPLSLLEDSEGKRVLDWIIAAIKSNNIDDINFVAGYHIEKIVTEYSHLRYFYNKKWDHSGSLESLLCAEELLDDEVIIINADVVFHHNLLSSILGKSGDIVVGNIINQTKLDYSGIIKLNKEGAKTVLSAAKALSIEERSTISLLHLIKNKIKNQNIISYSTINGEWAKVNENFNFSKFFIGSKRQTLERLKPLIQNGEILDQINFTVRKWQKNKESLISQIQKKFNNQKLIVRSSSHREDGFDSSQAGHFESILGVNSKNKNNLTDSIN